ncbi:MAG TPA: acyl-CoA dehydrogenase family protein [Thermoanaerobaculia bacterium]|nr:acyl-CoA dehydrogenase family protein [Thermoanaerobaculia bacterium]
MYRLTEPQERLLDELLRIASEHIAPHAGEVDEKARFPREALTALAGSGWLGLTIPEEYGGKGQGLRLACAALDEIAQNCASTAMVYLMHLCGSACLAAHPQGHEETLRRIASGQCLTTLAWSETGSRSHFWAPVSQAFQDNGHVVLNARKSWVTSAGEADVYIVSTRLSAGTETPEVMLYSVARQDSGVSVSGDWSALGLRGNESAPMNLENCRIPRERALCEDGKGFPRMMEILPWFNLGNCAISVGLAEAATRTTVAHLSAARLEHLDSRLADFPTLRARAATMRIETDRARAHLASALDALESGSPQTMLLVLESKTSGAQTAAHVTDLGMQACGGAAFSGHLSLERNFRDARAAAVMAPTSDVLLDFIGRALCGMDLF